MSKKKLNTEAIANELQQSAFFPSVHSPTHKEGGADKTVIKETIITPDSSNQEGNEARNKTERIIRTVEPNARTETDNKPSSLLSEITEGVKTDKRPTERYSFEIYSDQIPQIEELQYLYKKRTGQKLPASRILRESLEVYLKNAFEALKRKK